MLAGDCVDEEVGVLSDVSAAVLELRTAATVLSALSASATEDAVVARDEVAATRRLSSSSLVLVVRVLDVGVVVVEVLVVGTST